MTVALIVFSLMVAPTAGQGSPAGNAPVAGKAAKAKAKAKARVGAPKGGGEGARAGPLTLVAPEELTGDGRTAASLALELRPLPLIEGSQVLSVQADAGTLKAPERSGGRFTIEYVPPKVATELVTTVEAVVRVRQRTLQVSTRIAITPPPREVVERASSGPLRMRAPVHLVLGSQTSATITFDRPAGAAPVLLASPGTISPPVEAGEGRLAATYQLPEELYPQLAIIAVVGANGNLFDWIAIPLYGQAEVETQTDPSARVQVRVGDTSFGPVRASRSGDATLTIMAPPGMTTGTTVGADELGNIKEVPLDLGAPPFSRMLLVCPAETDRILLLAAEPSGAGAADRAFELSASPGSLAAPKMVSPGVYEAMLALPESVIPGSEVSISAALAGEPASAATCTTTSERGGVSNIKVALDFPTFTAGSEAPVSVSVQVADASGRPVTSARLALEVELGEIAPPEQSKPGHYTALWRLPSDFRGKRVARVDARAGNTASEASLELVPGRATALELQSERIEMRADGRESTRLTVKAADSFGNAVPAARLAASARGQVSSFSFVEDRGVFEAVYTAPRLDSAGRDRVLVRDEGGAESAVELALTPARKALAIGVKGGYSYNFGKVAAPVIAADVAVRLPMLWEGLLAGVEAGAGWSKDESKAADTDELVTIEVWTIPVLAQITAELRLGSLGLYAGPSVGAAFSTITVSSASSGTGRAQKTSLAYGARLGFDLALGPGRVLVEASYLQASLSGRRVSGNAGGLRGTVGYRLDL